MQAGNESEIATRMLAQKKEKKDKKHLVYRKGTLEDDKATKD